MADAAKLKPLLLATGMPVFAVLDGAQFDNLPDALFEGDFVNRSLYLDRGSIDRDRAGTAPQLVWLDRSRQADGGEPKDDGAPDEKVLDRLLALVDDSPAVVFWVHQGSGDALYRHLRTINMIQLPATANMAREKAYEQRPFKEEAEDEPSPYETVLFRHADANVMAQVLPSLSLESIARILGPAQQILYSPDADWHEKPMSVRKSTSMPVPRPGFLQLSMTEVQSIESARGLAARRRRVSYLVETCPAETQGATPEMLEQHLRVSEETGKKVGLVSEGAHCRWAFMMCKTNGRIAENPDAIGYITQRESSPDQRVQSFMQGVAQALEARHRAGIA